MNITFFILSFFSSNRNANKFDQCCFVHKALSNVNCTASNDDFSDCDKLIKDPVLQSLLWIIMVFVLVANVSSFTVRLFFRDVNNVSKLYILSLAVSDFLMGVFLAGILHKHHSLDGEYYRHDREWRNSRNCKALGVIALLSGEVSLGTLGAIAYVRYCSIVYTLSEKKISFGFAKINLIAIWMFGLFVSLIPAFVHPYFRDIETSRSFYGENALCLPLHLPGEKRLGWEYCFVLFGCVNFIGVCFILGTYAHIIRRVCFANTTRYSRKRNEDTFLAVRIILIILTDILCWIPVTCLIFLSLAGIVNDERDTIYSWFVVCVFPINSTINPLLYTFLTPRMWKKTKNGVWWFCTRICRPKGTKS